MHCSKARFVSASLLLTGLLIAQATGQTTTPAADSPAMEVRLQRLCDQLEKQRETLHIPGMAIAVIKDDKNILSRGFGVLDIESNLPATDETLFAIGSSTKAFTATLIGMLMDEGTMNWDEPPSKYLPNFHLSDAEADSQLAIRDLLCHRRGVGNADLLWAAGTASREKILETVCGAKLLSPFRKQFHYNNVMFLAAGQAAGRAAGKDWDAILAERILKPLGMASSTTSYESAQQNPMLSKGYDWDKEASEFKRKPMRNLSNIAPAGAINSNVKDMAQWVRLQLGRGEIDGKRLVSKERIEETWKPHITMAGDISYGLGWMLHKWNNHKLVEHGGKIDKPAIRIGG